MTERFKKIIKQRDGAAMVLAICVMAVTVALCLSIMAHGYRLYKASLTDREAVQTKELCVSAAGMIKKQLVGEWYREKDATGNSGADNLNDLVRVFMNGSNTSYDYTLEGGADTYYETLFDDSVKFKITLDDSSITVITTAETNAGAYRITDKYTLTKDEVTEKLEEETEKKTYVHWKISFSERS